MLKLFANRFPPRRSAALTLVLAAAGLVAAAAPMAASAASNQIAIIQDGGAVGPNSAASFQQFRALGANTARIFVPWSQIAPNYRSFRRPNFDASDPGAYPSANWAPYDNAVRNAQKYGIAVDFIVAGGAPQWAEQSVPGGYDPYFAYKPNAGEWGMFMTAIAKRYDGQYVPDGATSALPRVRLWTIFNEPNFGEDLGPQAINGSSVSVAPNMYRGLVNAAWGALHSTGHGGDTILIGGFAAQGLSGPPTRHAPQGYPGIFGQTKPLQFIRTLYCVDNNYRQLRGAYAKARGCPTSASGSRSFKAQNPGLFAASGVSDHPYPDNGSPVSDGGNDPDYATFPDLGRLARVLDKVNEAYASSKKYLIYNDEYGYITHPPARSHYVSPTTAAYYINWAEYLSWKNPRVQSYMQYLVKDPPNTAGPYAGFASGLEYPNGSPKPTYAAYRLPLYLPQTSFSRQTSVEVWGDVRPAPFMQRDGNGVQTAQIQFQTGGSGAYQTIATVNLTQPGAYFDLKLKFASGGNVRLAYTYPQQDQFLPMNQLGAKIYSRSIAIRVH